MAAKDLESTAYTPLLKDIESFPRYLDGNDVPIERMDNVTIGDKVKSAFEGFLKTFTGYDLENNPVTRCMESVACLMTCTSVCCIAIQIIFAAIPIAMVVIGVVHMNDCTVERFIPIYLYVAGSVAIASMLINFIMMIWSGRTLLKWLLGLMSLFSTAWLVTGSVWVYKSYNGLVTNTPGSPNYCHPSAYYLAFWVITSVYAVLGTCIFIFGSMGLICCCYMCCICCQISSCFAMPSIDTESQDIPEQVIDVRLEKGALAPAPSSSVTVSVDDNLGEYWPPEEQSVYTKETDEQIRYDVSMD